MNKFSVKWILNGEMLIEASDKETAESLAQQQLVRAKLIDLGMRNVELRNVLEAHKRAASARSFEDALPKAKHKGLRGDGDDDIQTKLDRSAL